MASRAPLTTPSAGSSKHNSNPIGSPDAPRAPLTRSRLSRHPEAEAEWLSGQNETEILPSQKVAAQSSSLSAPKPLRQKKLSNLDPSAQSNSHQNTAQAALDFDSSQDDSSSGDTNLHEEGLDIDPELLTPTPSRENSNNEHQTTQSQPSQQIPRRISIHDVLSAPRNISTHRASGLFETNTTPSAKRKDTEDCTAEEPQAKKFRLSNDIAAELQAPLPPSRAFLPPKGQFQPSASHPGTEARHRVSLASITPHSPTSQPSPNIRPASVAEIAPMAVPQHYHLLEYIRKHNQHLEVQLFNRNFENNRQADEIRRSNEYAARAKRCMRKDGEDINHLRTLVLHAKNKLEIWEKMLRSLEVLEITSTETVEVAQNDNRIVNQVGVATRVVQDIREVVKNFNKTLKDIQGRPVHEIDEVINIYATFNH
ncbi:hypothetical protein TWF694_010733 [Orbilia ellipsospora]|uniref:Uncharacterized protein n=1 Tax=Orbilia ellipsospora TaxID=2528407 RepID=A0AAV9X896_9PEZI